MRRPFAESIVADPGANGEEDYDEGGGEEPADGGASSFPSPPTEPPEPEPMHRTSSHGRDLLELQGLTNNKSPTGVGGIQVCDLAL